MNETAEKKPSYITEVIVGAGYILLCCLAVSAVVVYLPRGISQGNVFATSLPPLTPSPHIPMTHTAGDTIVFEDDFSNNQHNWTNDQGSSKPEVRDGQLIIESLTQMNLALTGCASCAYREAPYYLQADLATNQATDESYGVAFRGDDGYFYFYLFNINPESKKYYLHHRTTSNWSMRLSGQSDQIRSYPATNTVGIYLGQDTVEFYINGNFVDTYTESGALFYKGYFGFSADNNGFELAVDNLTVEKVDE